MTMCWGVSAAQGSSPPGNQAGEGKRAESFCSDVQLGMACQSVQRAAVGSASSKLQEELEHMIHTLLNITLMACLQWVAWRCTLSSHACSLNTAVQTRLSRNLWEAALVKAACTDRKYEGQRGLSNW